MGAVSVDQRAPIGPLPVGAKLGRYEILGKLAAGGMAIVYVARAHGVAGFERLVAIKVLHANLAHEDEFIKMFLDEARLAASIRHPNVVPTIDISDSEKSGYFLVMEYIEGDHLGQLLSSANKASERLPIRVTLRVICDALGGLGAAHDLRDEQGNKQNLVHRDVSPHNIMVGRDGVARLTDFGVAKAEDRLTHTRDGQVKGKLAYMAPEQAASGTTDTRSDLFSMGVILWECLTGQRLLRAESTAATLHKLLHGEIPVPSSVVPELAPLDAVLGKALSRDPEKRFQSAEEFQRALEDVASSFSGTASLRDVGKVVKHHAAAKLKRDKKLIDDALKALRPADAPEQGIFTDETSSPTTPSSTEISIVAGAANPSLFSKVNTVTANLANDTMPGNRRAVRRTGDMPVVPEKLEKPEKRVAPAAPPPLGASDAHEVLVSAEQQRAEPVSLSIDVALPEPTDAGAEPVTRNILGPRENAIDPADAVTEQPVIPSSMLVDPALLIEAEAVPAPEPMDFERPMSEPPASKRRMQAAVLVIGIAALAFLGIWASSSPQEVVKVEEIGPAAPTTLLKSTTISSIPETKPEPRNTLPVATLPASSLHEVRGVADPASPTQAIAPVVPSAASSAQSGARIKSSSTSKSSGSAKQSSRRRRESVKPVAPAAPHLDVIPNPYHD